MNLKFYKQKNTTLALFCAYFFGLAPTLIFAQDSSRIRQNVEIGIGDEFKGLHERFHHDSRGNPRNDLYQKSVAESQKIAAGTDAYLGASVAWQAIGPAPAIVNSYITGNGQLPGPNVGAVLDIAIDPRGTTDQTLYAATNAGGLWKTTDGGNVWQCLTDDLGASSFGAVAIDPIYNETIYAGTGSNFSPGYAHAIGVYRSDDGGTTWTLTGANILKDKQVNKILVPRTGYVLVATNKGLFLSTNGGGDYDEVPFERYDETLLYGQYVTDLDYQLSNPNRVWASVAFYGIYQSLNYGVDFLDNLWSPERERVPEQFSYYFVSLAISEDAGTMYASLQALGDPRLAVWRASHRGMEWEDISDQVLDTIPGIPDWRQMYNCQCGYDQTIAIDPTPSHDGWVYMGFQDLWFSHDNGNNWTDLTLGGPGGSELMHVDHHALTFSPPSHRNAQHPMKVWVGTDGGIWSSDDNGTTWQCHNQDLSGSPQMSFNTGLLRGIDMGRGENNNQWVYGGMQDNGTAVRKGNTSPGTGTQPWYEWMGGDGGDVAVDWNDPEKAYGFTGGEPIYTHNGGDTSFFADSRTLKFEFAYGFPAIETNPGNGHVYIGGYNGNYAPTLYRSTDQGHSYEVYYTFLNSTADTHDEYAPVYNIPSIAVTPADINMMLVGLPNGAIYKQVSGNEDAPSFSSLDTPNVTRYQAPRLAINQDNPNLVVAVYAGYSESAPSEPSKHVFLSTDGGHSWKDISGTTPDARIPDVPTYAAVFDPNTEPNSILVSSDVGVFRSYDFGLTWHLTGDDLPHTFTIDLEIDATVNPSLVRTGSYGRGAWESYLPVEDDVFGQFLPASTAVDLVLVKNSTRENLDLYMVSLTGEQTLLDNLDPQEYYPVYNSNYTGVLLARDEEDNIVMVYVINAAENQKIIIPQNALDMAKREQMKGYPGLKSYPGGIPVEDFEVINNSSQTLNLYRMGSDGLTQLVQSIGSQQPPYTVQTVRYGEVFTLSDQNGRVVSIYTASDAKDQTFPVDDTIIGYWD